MKRSLGIRAVAVAMAASMILSASTGAVSAKPADTDVSGYSSVSDASDASTVVTSTNSPSCDVNAVTLVGDTLVTASVPSGLNGAGTSANPYQITSVNDLLSMNAYINYESNGDKYFKLMNDISLSAVTFDDFTSADGIYSLVSAKATLSGNSNVRFVFDGNGKKLTDLSVTVPAGILAAGIFGLVNTNSSIQNLRLDGCTMRVSNTTDGAYGLLCVQNKGTIGSCILNNCILDLRVGSVGSAESSDEITSLACGKLCKGASLVAAENVGTVSGCSVSASDANCGIFVKGARKFVGFIAGQNRKNIETCVVSGMRILAYGTGDSDSSIAGNGMTASYIGAIAGRNNARANKTGLDGSVTNCTVNLTHGSDILFGDMVGGIVGSNYGIVAGSQVNGTCTSYSAVPNEASANMYGSGRFGGIAGVNVGSIESSGTYDLGFCFSAVSSQNIFGGIAGSNSGSVSVSVASGNVNVNGSSDASTGGIVGCADGGTTVDGCYALMRFSAQTSNSGAVLGKGGTLGMLGRNNYWSSDVCNMSTPVPNDGAGTNDLVSSLTVINVPTGAAGTTIRNADISNTWAGNQDARVRADMTMDATCDNSAISVSTSSTGYHIQCATNGEYGDFFYYGTVNLSEIGAGVSGKNVTIRLRAPVLVSSGASANSGTDRFHPIILSTYEQFKFIAKAPNAHYKLGADITVGSDWTVGSFGGSLDGDGYTLTISKPLFSTVRGSRGGDVATEEWGTDTDVSNLATGYIKNLNIVAGSAVNGAVFKNVNNATLENITYSASEDGYGVVHTSTGGALVSTIGGNVYLNRCYVSAPVTVSASTSNGIGALVGCISAENVVIHDCGSSSTMLISGNLSKVGGLIGYVESVSGVAKFSNCYASGCVYADSVISDFKPFVMFGGMDSSVSTSSVSGCYYSVAENSVPDGTVTKKAAPFTNGIKEFSFEDGAYNVANSGTTSVSLTMPAALSACSSLNASDFDFVFGGTDIELSGDATASGNVLTFGVQKSASAGTTYSVTLTVTHKPTGLKATVTLRSGLRVVADEEGVEYYEIYTKADLMTVFGWLRLTSTTAKTDGTITAGVMRTKNFKICANIDMGGQILNTSTSQKWMCNTATMAFKGRFVGKETSDGSKYTISNLVINGATTRGVGLFGYAQGAVFKNFRLDHFTVTGSSGTAALVGAVDVGALSSSTGNGTGTKTTCSFSDIEITNCEMISRCSGTATPAISNLSDMGTLCGSLWSTSTSEDYQIENILVSDCMMRPYSDAVQTLKANAVGGLIGEFRGKNTLIIGSADTPDSVVINNVTITGHTFLGGVLGKAGALPVAAGASGSFVTTFLLGKLKLQNVTVQDSSIRGGADAAGGVCGGLVGSESVSRDSGGVYSSTFVNCTFKNSEVRSDCNITSSNFYGNNGQTGGIAGYASGLFENCSIVDSKVTASIAGGIVGRTARKGNTTAFACVTLNNCYVLGNSEIRDNEGNNNGAELGGIISTAYCSTVTITNCGIGPDVRIHEYCDDAGNSVGTVLNAGGITGSAFVDEQTFENMTEANRFKVKIQGCTVSGKVESLVAVSGSNVGGVVGLCNMNPDYILIDDCVVDGELNNNNSMTGGIMALYTATGSGTNVITNCTVSASINQNTPATTALKTCKLVCAFSDITFSDSWVSDPTTVFHDNIFSSYPQDCYPYGSSFGGLNSLQGTELYTALQSTFTDVNKPNGSYIDGLTESFVIDGSAENPKDITISNESSYVGYAVDSRLTPYIINNAGTKVFGGWYSLANGLLTISDVALGHTTYHIKSTSGTSGALLVVDGTALSGQIALSDVRANYECKVGDYVQPINNSANNTVLTLTALKVAPTTGIGTDYIVNGHTVPGTDDVITLQVYVPVSCVNIEQLPLEGEGTQENPFLIKTKDDLNSIRSRDMSKCYALAADIEFTAEDFEVGRDFYNNNMKFIPIGYDVETGSVTPFTGSFSCMYDGTLYYLGGIEMSGAAEYTGLFASAQGATFHEIYIDNFTVDTTGSAAGALVGAAVNTSFTDIEIYNTDVTASVYAGSLAAYVKDVEVDNVKVEKGSVTKAHYVGGLFGHAATFSAADSNSIQNVTVKNMTVSSKADNVGYIAAGVVAEFSGVMRSVAVTKCAVSGPIASGVVGYAEENSVYYRRAVAGDADVLTVVANTAELSGAVVRVAQVNPAFGGFVPAVGDTVVIEVSSLGQKEVSLTDITVDGATAVTSAYANASTGVAGILAKIRHSTEDDNNSILPVNVTIDSCTVSKNVTVSGYVYAGGLIGNSDMHTRGSIAIQNSSSFAAVNARDGSSASPTKGTAASIVAHVADLNTLSVTNCNAGGKVTAAITAGGFIGLADTTTLSAARSIVSNSTVSVPFRFGYGDVALGLVVGRVATSILPTDLASSPFVNIYYSSYQVSGTVQVASDAAYDVYGTTVIDLQQNVGYLEVASTELPLSGSVTKLVLGESDIVFATLASGAVVGNYKSFTTSTNVVFNLNDVYCFNADNKVLFTWDNAESAIIKNPEVNGSGSAVFAYDNGVEIGFTVLSLNIEGKGTVDNPFIITEISHLDVIKSLPRRHFRLGANLDFNTPEGEQWESEWNTSFKDTVLTGTFTGTPGENYAIQNLTVNSTTGNVGFFGELQGTVDGIVFTNCTFTSAIEGSNGGSVVAVNNGTITNVTVSECTVSAPSHVGAVAGVSFGTISDCTVTNNTFVGTMTVGETTITAHCAGGVVGAALQLSDCTVNGATIVATDIAGGVIGGTLDLTELAQFGIASARYNNTSFADCAAYDVKVTSVYCAGGILGKAEAGKSTEHRAVSITGCTLDADPETQSRITGVTSEITVDFNSTTSFIGIYAGGILGCLDNYFNGFVLSNCASYGTVTARSVHKNTNSFGTAGAMFGGTVMTTGYRLSLSDGNTFSMVNNICGGQIRSTHYAGGVTGRFVGSTSSGNVTSYGFGEGDFMSGNVISCKFEELVPYSTDSSLVSALGKKGFGIIAGLAKNNLMFKTTTSAVKCITSNYYSSDVTVQGDMASLKAFGSYAITGITPIGAGACELFDVASGPDGKSFMVRNQYLEGDALGAFGEFEENVNGKRYFATDAENVYPKPVQIVFNKGTNATGADLGSLGSAETVYTVDGTVVRQIQLNRLYAKENLVGSCYTCQKIEYAYTYKDENEATVSDERYAANLTVLIENCPTEHQPVLVADLGYGLEIYLNISPTGEKRPDGKPGNPYLIDGEDAFVDYFFGKFAATSAANSNNDYLTMYYRQTVDLDFALILSKIASQNPSEARATQFAPIGTNADLPFTGGYDGNGYRISGFTYTSADPTTENYVGLFGYVADAQSRFNGLRLKNIHIELADAGVSGGANVGGLVGAYASNETIQNCSVVYGTVTGSGNVGGLVGSMCDTRKDQPSLNGCFTSTNVRSTADSTDDVAVGGLVGTMTVSHTSKVLLLSNCFTSSDVVGMHYTGGFIGKAGTSGDGGLIELDNCSNTATVTSALQLGSKDTFNTSLLVGYKATLSGGVQDVTKTYVTANNIFAGGPNATQYCPAPLDNSSVRHYFYPVLFGLVPLRSGGNAIYYDASSLGRISVPTGDTYSDFITIQGEMRTGSGTPSSNTASYTPMSTSAITSADFDGLGENWVYADGDLYPYLNVGSMFNDTYSDIFAKLSAIPVFMDSREADDLSAERTYTGITYPSMISAKVDGYNLSIRSSEFSAETDTVAYPDGYDAKLFGAITATGSGTFVGNDDKSGKDLLFRADCDLTENAEPNFYSILRNSYLNCSDSSVSRDEKSPAVTLTIGSYTRHNGTENVQIQLHRDIRIPLRGENALVYIATERQLRAIMNSRTGKPDSAEGTKFYNAYNDALNKGVFICADIDMCSESFTPISGYNGDSLKNTFDGGNCYINGLTINQPDTMYVGFFDQIVNNDASPQLSNILLKNVYVEGGRYTGALAGAVFNKNTLINNCMVITDDANGTYKVSGEDYVGGLFGYLTNCSVGYGKTNYDAPFTPKQVSGADVAVEGANYVGGFAGYIKDANVSNCFAKGDVSRKSNDTSFVSIDVAYGGFVGKAEKSGTQKGTIQYSFASGSVNAGFTSISSAGSGTLNIGVGGFAGVTEIPVLNCFASGDVRSSAQSFPTIGTQTIHAVGGLVGVAKTQSVTNCYSSSVVTYAPRFIPDSPNFTAAVGGVVGYANVPVSQAYSSGSVQSYTGAVSAGGKLYNGGVVGYAASTADHVYFDKWTNSIQDLKAVGNMADDTYIGSFTTDEFCDGTLLTASENYLSDTVWGCDTSTNSNTYPYLLSFCESTASDYVRYPAVLSVVAVRPNDRDEAVKEGIGYSMALTVPNSLKMAYIENNTTTMRTYKLDWDSGSANINDGSGLIVYGDNTIAPIRTKNVGQDLCIVMWVESFSFENEEGSVITVDGCYEKSNRFNVDALEVVADDVTIADGAKMIHISEVQEFGKGDYTPAIGDYIVAQSFKAYGTRTVRKFFIDMRGTETNPYMISSARDLQHIGFTVDGGMINNAVNDYGTYPDLYDQWYSPLDSGNNNVEGTVYFKLITNIDMTKKVVVRDGVATTVANDEPFVSIPSMSGNNYGGIEFKGLVLDGDDYAIDNFSANGPFVTTLDSESQMENIIFNNATISGDGDMALIGTNNGTVDGLMVLSDDETGSSVTSASGSAAGIAVVNRGAILNSIVHSDIAGGKYIGGISAENYGVVELCVSDSNLIANSTTLGIGGLVGRNYLAGTISKSFSLGNVNSSAVNSAYAGGSVGQNDGSVAYSYSRTVVDAAYPNAGSFVGYNTDTASVTDSFSAGKMILSGTSPVSTGSAFAGNNEGNLVRAYADKALLGSNTYMLVGDAEVTENIISGVCFGSAAPFTYAPADTAYPQLSDILAGNPNAAQDATYTFIKYRLLQAYSTIASVTIDTAYARYVDAMAAVANPVSSADADYTVSPVGSVDSGSGYVQALKKTPIAQKISAGSNTTDDDLKFRPTFTFDYAVAPATPNFTGGTGSAADPYIIASNGTYTAAKSFESLAYFGKATDAAFKLTEDVTYGGAQLVAPITSMNGIFDGDGHTVSDLTVTNNGLFGTVQAGTVRNLGLVGIKINATPAASQTNFGLLAGATDGATIEDVYAVGELKVNANDALNDAVHVGGLIGYAKDSQISNVVTSGYVENQHTADGSTVGGVTGLMNGGTLSAVESTAYVNGQKLVGGIVGKELNGSMANVIFAGTATGETSATVRNIVASESAKVGGIAYYDRQLARVEDDTYTGVTTTKLVRTSVSGAFVANASKKYYPSPITIPANASDTFKNGLNFALARINVSLGGGEGRLTCYDQISVTTPVGNAYDTVKLAEVGGNNYLSGDGTSALTPDGGSAHGLTQVTATLNTQTGSTFQGAVNPIYRYLEPDIIRVIEVEYVLTDNTGTVESSKHIGLMIRPEMTGDLKISSDAVTSTEQDANHTNTVRFGKTVVTGSGFNVDAVLPEGGNYTYSVSLDANGMANGYGVDGTFVTLGTTDSVRVYVTILSGDAVWGLRSLSNGLN